MEKDIINATCRGIRLVVTHYRGKRELRFNANAYRLVPSFQTWFVYLNLPTFTGTLCIDFFRPCDCGCWEEE